MKLNKHTKDVLILGAGFGGVRLAQILGKDDRFSVKLMDPKSFMEYHAATYRMTTGRSAAEVCIPYTQLVKAPNVEMVKDIAASVDLDAKTVTGADGSTYRFDALVFALGCEPSFFGIEGVEEHAFSINSVNDALRLRRHIHECFESVKTAKPEEKTPLLHVAVIGGGASGVELSGELAAYARSLAKAHDVDPSLVTVDLIEAMPRLLPALPEKLSKNALQQLRTLGVNVYLNRTVVKETIDTLFLKDMQMTAKTVVWTAGLKGNGLMTNVKGVTLDRRGRAVVDERLKIAGYTDVYAIGDIASTTHSGMAQTALIDAAYVARSLQAEAEGGCTEAYVQKKPAYAVPVGPGFAVVLYHGMMFSGAIGWFLRRAADFRAFLSLLSPMDAWNAFLGGYSKGESCPVCR